MQGAAGAPVPWPVVTAGEATDAVAADELRRFVDAKALSALARVYRFSLWVVLASYAIDALLDVVLFPARAG